MYAKSGGYERGLTRAEVAEELGVGAATALAFLREHGLKVSGTWVISQRALRLMQVDGTLSEWMSAHNGQRGRPRKG